MDDSDRPGRRYAQAVFAVTALLVALAGIALRANNALRYRTHLGFDASFNWEYIHGLMQSWTLPDPDSGWSTAHPPLFYYLSAAIGRALADGEVDIDTTVRVIRLLSALAGLLGIGAAVLLVRRVAPQDPARAVLAGALLLFLPAHIYMSAMLNEEILVSALVSLVVAGTAWDLMRAPRPQTEIWWAAGLGLIGGLALLTKLSGLLVLVAVPAAYLIHGWRETDLRQGLTRAGAFTAVALLIGGWFYARNWIQHGYVYPHALQAHEIMFTMPPGERGVGDYLRVPLATWTDPRVLSPDLLHSVWGTTYLTVWFDGHRHYLPKRGSAVQRAGTVILILALLPTVAFAVGMGRGLRRAIRGSGADGLLLLLVGLTLGGYAVFTWRNPWFAAVKGTYLLGLSVPFAFYTSEVLADWTRGRRGIAVWILLVALLGVVTMTFTMGWVFFKHELPGLSWTPVSPEAP